MALAPTTDWRCRMTVGGYVVMPDVLGPEGLASAITEATAICRGLRGEIEGAVAAEERDDDGAVLSR